MLVPRQTGCFTAVLHFFKGRKHQQPDAASEAPDTFSIFPTSLPPVGGPRSRGKEHARLAGLALGKVERTRTCLADDDTADDDDDDDLRSISTEASASRSARSHSSSLSALSTVPEKELARSKKVIFRGLVNVVEYDAGDVVTRLRTCQHKITGLTSKASGRRMKRSPVRRQYRTPAPRWPYAADLARPRRRETTVMSDVLLRPLSGYEVAALRRDRTMASVAVDRKVRSVVSQM